jgi:trehalose/maltose hydrolase-like predicted phosphorylase
VSGDLEFLVDYGAEMMLEIARFWSSLARYNPQRGRYEIHGVMGPDEFHERYPGAADGGLRNNAYTNVMVAWICEIARTLLELLPGDEGDALRARIGLTGEEIMTWERMSRGMFVPFHDEGIISQFEGYEQLAELDWDAYRERYGTKIQRLDRILKAEGDDPNGYKASKQADTVMLFYILGRAEVSRVLGRLGYEFGADAARRTIEYYDRRTSHGSTLSFITHAAVLAAIDPRSSWERFLVALDSDVGDLQGGTTQEGVHLGVMAGTLDLIQRGYLGTEIRGDVLSFTPRLIDHLDGLSFQMQVRGTSIRVSLADERLTVASEGLGRQIKLGVGDDVRELSPGDRCTFSLSGTTIADRQRQEGGHDAAL